MTQTTDGKQMSESFWTASAFGQVRAIVNAKIEALRKRREELCMMMSPPPRVKRCDIVLEASRKMMSIDGAGEVERRRHLEVEKLSGASFRRKAARLPENLNVPSVEPRPPNLKAVNLSFAARLVIAVRDKFGGDAPKVYTAANVSRQAYSQIVSDETRAVSKRTAIRFAFALKSTAEEARILLKSAGYAFSNSQTEDFILQACLEVDPPIWDLNAVNQLLKEYRVDFQY